MELSHSNIETIAGLCAGFSTTVVTHPLDLIKVRLQLSSGHTSHPLRRLQDVVHKINHTARIEHAQYTKTKTKTRANLSWTLPVSYFKLHQYYRGITPNIIGNISAWSLYFTLYAEFKSQLAASHLERFLSSAVYFTSSALAGASTSLLTNPIWVLKTRILGSSNLDQGAYKSVFDGISQILAKEGPRSFWKGTLPSMFLVLQASLQFTFYDSLKAWTSKRNESSESTTASISTSQYIYISAVSKILSMVVMYPSQMVKARLQNHTGRGRLVDVCVDIWKNEGGLPGFYKGVGANIIRVVPATCITFVVYETTKDILRQQVSI